MREALRKTANTAVLIGGVLYLGYFVAQAVLIGYGSAPTTRSNLSTIQGYLVGSLSSLLVSFSGFAFAIGAILKLFLRNLKDVAAP
jgi:hypothetical protein